ncbi:hypothetical protein JI739_07325 [Ramlibacter sp. AW1]|uniref:Uncharacterized protein n=1 Tax=Ramlibacter aurantiacus TaxID=2801330 RepID=A0A937D6R9_9BURK|nr:hypothetical protein [Ramlibacter aurantiacus]MBL0420156.1 hypothetical protein [Ramlibacter aurantiacus]
MRSVRWGRVQPQAWRTALAIACWRHGLAGTVAAFFALAAAGIHWGFNLPAQQELSRLRAWLDRPARSPVPTAASTRDEPEAHALVQALQSAPELPEALRTIDRLAGHEQLALPSGEYRQHEPAAAAGLTRVLVTQPIRASYPQLRRYLEAVLRELPSASLDHISVRRESIGQPQLEARVQWSLWRVDSPSASAPPQLLPLIERQWLVPQREPAAHRARGRPAPELFAVGSWQPSATSATATPAAAPAQAPDPPPPFTYLGKQLADGHWSVFVAHAQETRVLREGQRVDGQWQIDRIAPPDLHFTYLPLGRAYTLTIGDER